MLLHAIAPRLIAMFLAAVALLAASPASGQTPPTSARVRVARPTVVMEGPRGDSLVLGKVAPGTVLEFVQQSGRWLEVRPMPGAPAVPWRRGWISEDDVVWVDAPPRAAAARGRAGEFMLRGFGYYGGTLFTAGDTFDAILGSPFGPVYGGGGQVVFGNGVFVQGSVERFEETGTRAIVSDAQVFQTDIANTVTVTPVFATIGYRDTRPGRLAAYLGGGVGWHQLEEASPALASTYKEGKIGYHVLGGAEFRIAPWFWLAGEVQWAGVPDGLGENGLGYVFDETDLGGTTFRVKVIVGR